MRTKKERFTGVFFGYYRGKAYSDSGICHHRSVPARYGSTDQQCVDSFLFFRIDRIASPQIPEKKTAQRDERGVICRKDGGNPRGFFLPASKS